MICYPARSHIATKMAMCNVANHRFCERVSKIVLFQHCWNDLREFKLLPTYKKVFAYFFLKKVGARRVGDFALTIFPINHNLFL